VKVLQHVLVAFRVISKLFKVRFFLSAQHGDLSLQTAEVLDLLT
jgi:hypothetical protein